MSEHALVPSPRPEVGLGRGALRPPGCTHCDLIPWRQLQPLPGGDGRAWLALGPDAHFCALCCLPAGWVRIRLRMTAQTHARAEIYLDTGRGLNAAERVERIEVDERGIAHDFFLQLREPAWALRFDPLDVEGEFQLDELRVEPISAVRALGHALRGKLRLLRAAGRLRRCLWNGLALLVRGRLDTFRAKLFQGLTGPAQGTRQRLQRHPEDENPPRAPTEHPPSAGSAEPTRAVVCGRVHFPVIGQPKINIIIPTAGRTARIHGLTTAFVANCVESIRRTSSYANYQILVLHNDPLPPGLDRRLGQLGATLVPYASPFNFSRVVNQGAACATGDHLVFLNDDTEVISSDWLECLLEHSQQPQVGAVGALLLFPDGRVQHAGVVIRDGHPIHDGYGEPASAQLGPSAAPRDCVAVTAACLMTRAEVFHRGGGFCEDFPLNYNDIDYCLRLRATGRRVIFTPFAQLYHYESATKPGLFPQEMAAFQTRWKDVLSRDLDESASSAARDEKRILEPEELRIQG
jgi:hypothetical protein